MITHRAPVKKALCVGCNYPSKALGLQGCVNDAFLLADLLKDHYNFEPHNVKVLHDMYIWSKKSDRVAEEDNSTRYNIQKGMEWLIADAKPGDVLFFSFSGYGIQVDEHPHGFADEGLEECLMPTDFMDERDRWCVLPLSVIHDTLLSVPVGVSVNVFFDCDNANTFLDMTGTMTGDWTQGLKWNGYFGLEPFARRMEHIDKDPRVWQEDNARDVKGRPRFQPASEFQNIRRGRTPQRVRMPKVDPVAFAFAGSRHDQACMECQIDKVWFEGRQKTVTHGCMTYAFVKAMEKTGYDCTVFEVVDLVNLELANIRESHIPNLDQEIQLTFAQPNSWPTRTKFLQPVDMSKIPKAVEPSAPWECVMQAVENITGLTGIAKSFNGIIHNWLGHKNSHHEELIRAAKPSRHPPKVAPPKDDAEDNGKLQPQWWEEMMDQKAKAEQKYDRIREEKAAAREQSQRRTSAQIQGFLEHVEAHRAKQAEVERSSSQNNMSNTNSLNYNMNNNSNNNTMALPQRSLSHSGDATWTMPQMASATMNNMPQEQTRQPSWFPPPQQQTQQQQPQDKLTLRQKQQQTPWYQQSLQQQPQPQQQKKQQWPQPAQPFQPRSPVLEQKHSATSLSSPFISTEVDGVLPPLQVEVEERSQFSQQQLEDDLLVQCSAGADLSEPWLGNRAVPVIQRLTSQEACSTEEMLPEVGADTHLSSVRQPLQNWQQQQSQPFALQQMQMQRQSQISPQQQQQQLAPIPSQKESSDSSDEASSAAEGSPNTLDSSPSTMSPRPGSPSVPPGAPPVPVTAIAGPLPRGNTGGVVTAVVQGGSGTAPLMDATQSQQSLHSQVDAALPPTAVKVVVNADNGVARVPTRLLRSRTLVLQSLQNIPAGATEEGTEDITLEAKNVFSRIVGGRETDTMSRLQFIKALEDKTVASFCLPGIDPTALFEDEDTYEAAHHFFNDLSRGRQRVRFKEFLSNFLHTKATASHAGELRTVFERIDVNNDNKISRHELLSCVKNDQKVADFLLRKYDINLEDEEELSQTVDDVYTAISGDAKYFDFADFVAYFRSVARVEGCGLHVPIDRRQKRVLIIGPGFGAQLNPMQTQVVMRAGFQVHWVHGVPNPEEPDFNLLPHVTTIHQAIGEIRPDLLVVASKGGIYGTALWKFGYWRGPTVMINAHPTCKELPADLPIVITHGDQDPIYRRPRAELEALISTGSPNMCFLYYTSTSGRLASGHTPRIGDQHNMASLVTFECLPRLMESVLCPEGPELHMMRTWIERLRPERQEAERYLGFSLSKLRQFWVSTKRKQTPNEPQEFLFDVAPNCLEARLVSTVFRTSAKDPSTYGTVDKGRWNRMRIVRIQRVENAMQQDAGVKAYYESVKKSCGSMGIEFVPGVHTRWLFHGSSALDSIVSSPLQGFQPLASGSQGQSVWGLGTYFARDAEYVAAGPFCGYPAADGTRRMLLCLVTTGMSCAGDPNHRGILPFRRHPHRYNSSVDSLSSPEIYIVQHPGAAYPAYVITFIC
mmetsp:Transcript_77405/g.169398  ORF Transcript_77405/g.169398 Transcript_77405/m.169398 type:complete len:1511 (-) Transcript_77405:66-4598(-)